MRVFAFDLNNLPFSICNHNGGWNWIAGSIVHDLHLLAISSRYPVSQEKE
jgi:hypothetical protein